MLFKKKHNTKQRQRTGKKQERKQKKKKKNTDSYISYFIKVSMCVCCMSKNLQFCGYAKALFNKIIIKEEEIKANINE